MTQIARALAVGVLVAIGCSEAPGDSLKNVVVESIEPPVSSVMQGPPVDRSAGGRASAEIVRGELYRVPAHEVIEVVDAAPFPELSVSPDGSTMVLLSGRANVPIDRLAEPMLGLAGRRLNTARSETWIQGSSDGFDSMLLLLPGGKRLSLGVPGKNLGSPHWSPDGSMLAFSSSTKQGVELWLVDTTHPTPRRLLPRGRFLNGAFGSSFAWLPDSSSLIVRLVPKMRGMAPVSPKVPSGPTTHESDPRRRIPRPGQDLLGSALDEARYQHYYSSEIARVGIHPGTIELQSLGDLGIFCDVKVSPDGHHLLVTRIVPPFSRRAGDRQFARDIEIWPAQGGEGPYPRELVHSLPLADELEIGQVIQGPRLHRWHPLSPSTLTWVEALGAAPEGTRAGGQGDRMMSASMQEGGGIAGDEAKEVTRLRYRFRSVDWLEDGDRYLIAEYDRSTGRVSTYLRRASSESFDQIFSDRAIDDGYADRGTPAYLFRENGQRVVRVLDESIFLHGVGASPDGNRPFLDRVALDGGPTVRLYHSGEAEFGQFVRFLGEGEILLREEAPGRVPNYFRRVLDGTPKLRGDRITDFGDPYPRYRGVGQELLRYSRADGTPLSALLYLPPGANPGDELPLVTSIDPRAFDDAVHAGQIRISAGKFLSLRSSAVTMFLTQGYAVMDQVSMPIVGGTSMTANDFMAQITESAEAAIDAAVATGFVRRDRIGVVGDSEGAFVAANLIAHTDLFVAGVVRSGAYSPSLTPFDFQGDTASFWRVPKGSVDLSPLFSADQVDDPLLIIHGAMDNSLGTNVAQSRSLFHALRANHAIARLVVLPRESHEYLARESVLHVLDESFAWFETHFHAR